jgi:AcrR family transcriptional regulator
MANEALKLQNLDKAMNSAYHLFLENGISKTTKEMIARKSGLSRKSIDRYFSDKVDCVIHVAKWFLSHLREETSVAFPSSLFDEGGHTGAELLQMYMEYIKDVFTAEPRIFVLYTEYKTYIYRNCEDVHQGYTLLINWLGNHELRERIFDLGIKDGSLPPEINFSIEEEYFCESFFGFLSNLALSYNVHSSKEINEQIDERIKNTIALYTGVSSYTR